MQKIERSAQPDCLRAGCPGWTKDFVAARERDPAHPFKWRSQACYREIRRQLSAMTMAHCAFCDGAIGVESRETVEHFRPKSAFPDLAYEWNNRFPCCDMCQSNKREMFDPDLLKPDAPEYAFSTYFVANFRTGELEPSPRSDEKARLQAGVTIRIYGLNLPARKKARKREWERFVDPKTCLDDYNYRFSLADKFCNGE
ncbi:MAG: hypothetical protein HY777_01010 [Betaproteobacteria bacterium]|nr:hypothetical protein [Betaproteobacteria bacterium]